MRTLSSTYIHFDKPEDEHRWDVDLTVNGSGRWIATLYDEEGLGLNVYLIDNDPLHLAQTLEFIATRIRADYRKHLAREQESA
jgi:hypothetical protein